MQARLYLPIVCVLAFTSCRAQVPQDATKSDNTQSTTGAISKASGIVGTWSMYRIEADKETKSLRFTFRDDGTLTSMATFHDGGEPMKTTGKYEVKESTLRLLYAGKSRWREVQIQLVDGELVFYGNNQSKDYFRRK